MERFTGLIGIVLILGIAFLFSNNKKRINIRLVGTGLLFQFSIALLVLKVPAINRLFSYMGKAMLQFEGFAKKGVDFVCGNVGVVGNGKVLSYREASVFIFAFNITAIIILVCMVVAVLYHFNIMQTIVSISAKAINYFMKVSGAEILSAIGSVFVGQIEAQVLIKEYLPTMTKSELLTMMSGNLACIAGGVLIVYANMGARPDYLMAASMMSIPGSLVISKIVFPEIEVPPTMGNVTLRVKTNYTNIIDALTHGVTDGLKIAVNVVATLIGFIALIAMINWMLWHINHGLSLDSIFGALFYPFAWAMGIPRQDINNAATLLGQKLTVNEFVAFINMTDKTVPVNTQKGLTIITIAIAGFANFSSVGMQITGIGRLAPERRSDLARLAMKALLCGTLASYLSATIAGIVV